MNMADRDPQPYHAWLHRCAVVFVLITFGLLILGGTVTSKGAALAVHDYPRSLGYNLFLLPPSMWVGGIFWEHTHRLLGSIVGLCAILMAFSLWWTQRRRPWLQWVGVATLALIIAQGVMGGLRVRQLSTTWAVLHGMTGQIILCATVLVAAALSKRWINGPMMLHTSSHTDKSGRRLSIVLLAALLIQLGLGAMVRHTGAALAVPDFPANYGGLIPPLTQQDIITAHDTLVPYQEFQSSEYPTPVQVATHFTHRLWAVAVLALAVWTLTLLTKQAKDDPAIARPSLAICFLLIAQTALGAMVIYSGRHPEVATAHQATGAAIMGCATLLVIRLHALQPSLTEPTLHWSTEHQSA